MGYWLVKQYVLVVEVNKYRGVLDGNCKYCRNLRRRFETAKNVGTEAFLKSM